MSNVSLVVSVGWVPWESDFVGWVPCVIALRGGFYGKEGVQGTASEMIALDMFQSGIGTCGFLVSK